LLMRDIIKQSVEYLYIAHNTLTDISDNKREKDMKYNKHN